MTSKAKTFWTSDLHFHHANILRYCNRPFKDVNDMNEGLVENWNKKVSKDSLTYILGDVSFGKEPETVQMLKRLNGRKALVIGNHDIHQLKYQSFRDQFISLRDLDEVTIQDPEVEGGKTVFVMCHYAMRVWSRSNRGAIQLYGHTHGTLPGEGLQLDVGVDSNDFTPMSYDDIMIKLFHQLHSTTQPQLQIVKETK